MGSLSISISISIFLKYFLSISIFSNMTISISISISIFFKSVDISTIDMSYRYIEQGYLTETTGTELLSLLQPTSRKMRELAEHLSTSGTLTQVSWQVSWPEFGRALSAGKDLHSPLQPPSSGRQSTTAEGDHRHWERQDRGEEGQLEELKGQRAVDGRHVCMAG